MRDGFLKFKVTGIAVMLGEVERWNEQPTGDVAGKWMAHHTLKRSKLDRVALLSREFAIEVVDGDAWKQSHYGRQFGSYTRWIVREIRRQW